jgi:hypothetical protein
VSKFLALPFTWLSLCAVAATPSAADLARTIREAGLDPDACYRVHDLTFYKEDVRVYLTDGYLIFSKPVMGERLAAVFTADVEGGDGEVMLLPPYRGERQSMAAFTQSPNLDEHVRAALMVFTDGTARTLMDRITKEESGRKAPEMGPLLAEKWAPVVANVTDGFQLRLVQDLMAASLQAPGRRQPGLTFLAVNGKQFGSFDIVYDPSAREQVLAGQLTERDSRLVYNVWTSFASRSVRASAAKPTPPGFSLNRFRIDAALDSDLRVKATTRVSVRVGADPLRVFPFGLSRAMHVTSARIDGAPAELFFRESVRGRALRYGDDDIFLLVAPDGLAAGSEHELEFEHEGAVIASAGNGVYYVGARATWYPHSTADFATYELSFRYPKRLTLVTPGDMVEDRIDGDWRMTRRRTPVPIRLAGFNLGEYEEVASTVAGLTVEVYGNRHLESALQPKPQPRETEFAPAPIRPGRPLRPDFTRVTVAPPAPVPVPDPLARLRSVAEDVSSSLGYFSGLFGPPALKTLTVAPIPGAFGQGFPGLVYLSTLAYLDPGERPATLRNPRQQVFFSDLMEAHEVAHQWWGNVVTTNDYQDEWLLESLANYSALLWLEKKKGAKALESVLDDYRNHLLADDGQGHNLESAGPIIWGRRLSSGVPDAWRAITYEKGAWIMHMLRRRLGDQHFLKILSEMLRRHEFRSVSTEDFRALIKESLPPGVTPESIDTFFDNWVYSTGIPSLKVRYAVKIDAASWKVSGSVAQSGVDDDFAADVPVEIQFSKGAPQTIWVRTSGDSASFSATLRQQPSRVALAPAGVLAKK